MTDSKIEWTGRSDWNPIRGCTRVSEGCRHCYAEQIAGRFSDPGQPFHGFARRTTDGGRWTGKVALVEDRMTLPLRWRKPATIFASSTSDIFHESLSDTDIDRIFAVMALTPQHTYQVLTKRAERMRAYFADPDRPIWVTESVMDIDPNYAGHNLCACDGADGDRPWPLPNVWLGVSVEDQANADARIPHLLATPAAKRFLSCEPLLGAVNLSRICLVPPVKGSPRAGIHIDTLRGRYVESGQPYIGDWDIDQAYPVDARAVLLDWVIVGGESGRGARPMHPDWSRSLRDQCAAEDVPFFFKQWGDLIPVDELNHGDGSIMDYPAGIGRDDRAVPRDAVLVSWAGGTFERVGKARAGRLLDGVQHDAMPV